MKLLGFKRGNMVKIVPNELAESISDGEYFIELKRPHNYQFHKKMFALVHAAFEMWDIPEGARKSIDVFRDELTIECGHYETIYKIDGTYEKKAKSWSYSKMTDIEKEQLYSKLIDVILLNVLPQHDRESLLKMEEQILNFV